MKKLPKLALGIALILCLFVCCGIERANAADISSIGIATYMPIDGDVEDGDIITSSSKGNFLSSKAYDAHVVGVVTKKPAIALRAEAQQQGVPVVNVGTVMVKVIGTNGNIKRGDYITTSDKKGIGMKSSQDGYILGQAMEDLSFENKTDVEMVVMSLNLHFLQSGTGIRSSFWDIFSLSKLAAYQEPVRAFKYVVSAIVLLISFGFGFLIFSRAINTGIQALGRNPLAARMIQLSILFNVVLVIIIIMSGIGIVWIFLRL